MSTPNIKFTQLDALTNLSNDDIFAVVDDANSQFNSKKITAKNIAKYVFSYSADGSTTSVLTDDGILPNIKSALNGSAAISNQLRASFIWYDNQYQPIEDVLLYDNIGGIKPEPIDSNSEIANTEGYVSLRDQGAGLQLTVVPTNISPGSTPNTGLINTDQLVEGDTNLFFRTSQVELALQNSFQGLFNTYSDVFDGGNTTASVQGVKGTWAQSQGTYPNTTSFRLAIPGPNTEPTNPNVSAFQADQIVRIYGASGNTGQGSPGNVVPAVTVVPASAEGTGAGSVKLDYRFAKFDLKTGAVGARTGKFSVDVRAPGATSTDDTYQAFSRDFFVKVNFQGVSDSEGVLIYRRTSTAEDPSVYKLTAVCSGIDLPIFKDYYMFDFTQWSGKSDIDNTYPSDIIHFPATIAFDDTGEFGPFSESHDETLRGWVDQKIKDIIADDDAAVGGGYQLVFDDLNPVYINHPEGMLSSNVTIAHNDTDKIRKGIQTKRENNIKNLSLNAKTYNVSQITLNQSGLFGLSGVLGMTKLAKLPWSGYPDGLNASNSILIVPGNDAQSVSLENIDFDGNMLNQFLLSDTNNRFIDFGNNSTDVTIHNCKIDNIIGDGVYASLPLRFKLSLSTISNSSTTDRHDFFPLIVDSGVNTLVNGNVIQNFTTGIDATVTTESVIANNVIKNVGNGLDIYGSTFMVSSPNVLMGPANEFLSTPDVLNSEYDVINLLRSRISLGAGFYDSDSYVYQEGATPSVYDLTQNSISDNDYGEVIYRVDAILVDSDGDHSPYGRNIGPSHKDASGSSFTHDYFQTNKVYQIVEVGDTDWTKWGACVNKVGTRFVYNGHTNNSDLGTTGAVSAREFAGYNDGSNLHPPLTFTDVSEPTVDKSIGEFKFRIGDDSGSGNPHTTWSDLTSGAYTSTALKNNYLNHVKTALDDSTADHVHPFGTKHFGLQWSASYRYYVRAGEIQENQVVGGVAVNNGEWTQTGRYDANGKFGGVNINGGTENDSLNANRYFADFTVTIEKLDYVQAGDHVIFQRGSTFDPYIGGGHIVNSQYNGFVVVKTPQAGLTTTSITIRYYGDTTNAPDLTVLNSAVGINSTETGTLNILDDFVMAQGLIK